MGVRRIRSNCLIVDGFVAITVYDIKSSTSSYLVGLLSKLRKMAAGLKMIA